MEAETIVCKEEKSTKYECNGSQEEFTNISKNIKSEPSISKTQKDVVCKLEENEVSITSWDSLTWSCHYCNNRLYDYKNLRSHLLIMHDASNTEETYYECNDCKQTPLGYASFINHIRSVHYEDLRLCCDVCNERFADFKQLSVHRDRHNEALGEAYPVIYHCTLCEYVQPTEKELKTHIQQKHKLARSAEEGIEELSRNSFMAEVLETPIAPIQCKEEINETEQIFQCGKCANSFSSEIHLQLHVKTHQKSPFLKCDRCSKSFSCKHNLKMHMRSHAVELPFQCEICSKTYSRNSTLAEHMHLHTGDLPYKCDYCAKSFGRKASMFVHLRVHSEELPFPCEICKKRFATSKEKKDHVRNLHSDVRMHSCKVCSKSFKKYWVMKRHTQNCKGLPETPLSEEAKKLLILLKSSLPPNDDFFTS